MYFLFLSICKDELITAPNNNMLLPISLPLSIEKNLCVSNPIPQPEYLYFLGTELGVNLTTPKKNFVAQSFD